MVSLEINNRFALNQGRKRPKYKPMDIHCPKCGAGLEIKDERARLVVCDYCSSQLELSEDQLKVLGKGPARKWDFPLELGDSFKYRGARYEVIARQAFIEDHNPKYTTREYLLYNPRRGTLWLDEYEGRYSLSWAVHVKAKDHPFSCSRGEVIETWDNRKWVCEETGVYELAYVDGALPWVAKVGDLISYAEFSEKSRSGMLFDVQMQNNEIEYSYGKKLPLEFVRKATGKGDKIKEVPAKMDAAQTRAWYIRMQAIALAFLLLNIIAAVYAYSAGNVALRQSFSPGEISSEKMTKPFNVSQDNNVIKAIVTAPTLSNAWMSVNLAVIKGEDKVIHVFDEDMEYYHGVEGGESWSEGSNSKSAYIKIPEKGNYRLLITARSAKGETASATRALHGLEIMIKDNAIMPHFFIMSAIISMVVLVILIYFHHLWKTNEED